MTTLAIDIRNAQCTDAGDIASIYHASWTGAYSGILPHRTLLRMINRRGPDWWSAAIKRRASILVVELGGAVVGYATIGRNRTKQLGPAGEIYELYILPEYQGLGLGTRLFEAARDKLRGYGLKGLVVWALEDNGGAVSFYAGRGGYDCAEGVEVFEGRTLKKIAFRWQ